MKSKGHLRFLIQAALSSFTVYFCMYAFRKPYTVAKFDELVFWGIDYKILLITTQVLGYALAKFLGIKFISGLKNKYRSVLLLGLIFGAELFLLLFAILPKPLNISTLFFNGLFLGMIWGIVYSYIEGRRNSELLGVILCSSFIVSSGMVKSVGKYVMDVWSFSEYWMPFITGLVFIIPLAIGVHFLEKLPKASNEEKIQKTERLPMSNHDRKLLFKNFGLPIILIVAFFTLLTVARDFRDNFAPEIWSYSENYKDSIAIYTLSEIPISILVLLIFGLVGSIPCNYNAIKIYHRLLILGVACVLISTAMFQFFGLNFALWMVISGFGIYLCYVPFNGLYFDRLISTFKLKANTSFLIFMSDAFGYFGGVIVMLYKNFGFKNSWLAFFIALIYLLGFFGLFTSIFSYKFLKKKYNGQQRLK